MDRLCYLRDVLMTNRDNNSKNVCIFPWIIVDDSKMHNSRQSSREKEYLLVSSNESNVFDRNKIQRDDRAFVLTFLDPNDNNHC